MPGTSLTWHAISIHGDKSQQERDYVLSEFRNGKSPILVATDVAARGLDVEDVKYVINFDYPNSSEDYIHRIGRTGRCQQAGTAYTFFTSNNQRQAKELIAVLSEANQVINPKLVELAALAKNNYTGRNRWNNRNKDSSSNNRSSSGNISTWTPTTAANVQEFKPNNRYQPASQGQVARPFQQQKNGFQQSQHGGFTPNNFPSNGFPGAYGVRAEHQNYSQHSNFPPQGNFHQGQFSQNRPYGGQSNAVRSGNGYQQRFNRGQNYMEGTHQGVYSVPPPQYMLQANSEAGVQSLINHKFFQPNRPPPQSNPCAYQSGYAAQFHQPAMPYTYQYSQPQAVQQ